MGKFVGLILRFTWFLLIAGMITPPAQGQSTGSALVTPDWCRKLPRPEYSHLERVPVHDSWFQVYRVAPRVLAIYEPLDQSFS